MKVEKLIEESKETFYRRQFQKKQCNIKAQWNLVDNILGNNKRTINDFQNGLIIQNKLVQSNNVEISDALNNYFINIVNKIKPIVADINDSVLITGGISNPDSFFLQPVTPAELITVINSLSNKVSSGTDNINTIILKRISTHIVDVLCYIINLSFNIGIFPNKLQESIIVPIFKKGERTDPNNYRPIALLPVFAKVFEKVVVSRMLPFLQRYGFFSDSQYGFRKGRNTEDALLDFLNAVNEGLNKKKSVAGLFIDLTKAFDMVDHELLLYKLELCGFRGTTNEWFRSYLTNRRQSVKVNGELGSSMWANNVGVPQGSVLGPILFLIYFNSLCAYPFNGKSIAFADDMAFVYTASSSEELSRLIFEDLANLRRWMNAHSMVLSPKTKVIFFNLGSVPKDEPCVVYHALNCTGIACNSDCLAIESVNSFKYLGIIIDKKLNWKDHISKLKSELIISIRKLALLRRVVPYKLLRSIYFALVNSRLEYGIISWGSSYVSNLRPLIIAQKHIIRLIHFKRRNEHSLPLFTASYILPLRFLYIYKVLKIFFTRSGNRIYRINQNYGLRRCSAYIPRPYNEHFRRSYEFIAPHIFNKLPTNIKQIRVLNIFLSHVKKWLFDKSEVESMLTVLW